MLHGSQEWGGKGLGKAQNAALGEAWAAHAFQARGGKGLGWFRKGKRTMKTGLGVSWFPRLGWEGFGSGSMRTSTTTSCCRGCVGRGICTWDGISKVGTGRYPGRLTMKHGEGMLVENGAGRGFGWFTKGQNNRFVASTCWPCLFYRTSQQTSITNLQFHPMYPWNILQNACNIHWKCPLMSLGFSR